VTSLVLIIVSILVLKSLFIDNLPASHRSTTNQHLKKLLTYLEWVLPMGKTDCFTKFYPNLPNWFYPLGKTYLPTLLMVNYDNI